MTAPSDPKGDEPRKIVVCAAEDYAAVQKAVASLGLGDVLVKPSPYCPSGTVFGIDPKAAGL